MSSKPAGIRNYDKMDDKDKSYLVKLIPTLVAGFLTGIITGIIYDPPGTSIWIIGFLIFFIVQGGMAYYIKTNFDLSDMSDSQIIRHGLFMGLFMYIFFWVVLFQFFLF